MKKIITLSAIAFLFFTAISAQPIVFETLFGNERVYSGLALTKPIGEKGIFRYQNITTASSRYDFTKGNIEVVTVNSFIWQFYKYIGASATMQYHFRKGFIPMAALHFSYANPTWLITFTPYFDFMPYLCSETSLAVEFKPQLTENLRLFTRAQGFLSFDIKKKEPERSMGYFRLGITCKQRYTVGAACNYDGYRPNMKDIWNFGGFFRLDI